MNKGEEETGQGARDELRWRRSAQQVRKPIFDLKKADGIGGGQVQTVALARGQFETLTKEILRRIDAI